MKNPASGIDLIGRKKELKLLLECLRKGQNVALVAPRRFGKSALIFEVLNQLKEQGYLTTHINLFSSPTPDLLSSALTREVLRNQKLHKPFQQFLKDDPDTEIQGDFKNMVEAFPFLSEFVNPARDEWNLLSESLNLPEKFAAKQQKQMVCAYEEMGILRKVDQGGKMSALFKSQLGTHSNTSYIFSGRHSSHMQDILLGGEAPMVHKDHVIYLDYIDHQVLVDSLKKKFSRLKLKLPRHYLNDLVELTKGHPYYTRQAIRHIILSYVLEGKVPGQKELPAQLLRMEKDYLEKTWEDIASNSEYVQILLALPTGSTNIYPRLKAKKINVARGQKKLEEMGLLLKKKQSGYSIADPLLELWIKKKL